MFCAKENVYICQKSLLYYICGVIFCVPITFIQDVKSKYHISIVQIFYCSYQAVILPNYAKKCEATIFMCVFWDT